MSIESSEVSERFQDLWDAFVEALPECELDQPHRECPVEQFERLEVAAAAVVEYVAQLERQASNLDRMEALSRQFVQRAEKSLV